jgi:hypothetical protein
MMFGMKVTGLERGEFGLRYGVIFALFLVVLHQQKKDYLLIFKFFHFFHFSSLISNLHPKLFRPNDSSHSALQFDI